MRVSALLFSLALVLGGLLPPGAGSPPGLLPAGFPAPREAEAGDRRACDDLIQRAKALINEAERTGNLAKIHEAAELLKRAERACEGEVEPSFWLVACYVFLGDFPNAQGARDRVWRMRGDWAATMGRPPSDADGDPWVLVADALVHLYLGGRPDLAVEKLGRVRARDREFMPDLVALLKWRAHMAYGSLRCRAQDYEKAIQQTRLAIEEGKGRPDWQDKARRNLAGIYRFADRWTDAQRVYEDLAQRYPRDAVIHYGLASVYADQLMYAKATETWAKVMQLLKEKDTIRPEEKDLVVDSPMRYANSLIQAGRFDEGWALLVTWRDEHPKDMRGWYWTGHNALEQWDDEEHLKQARDWLEKARALDPWCEFTLRDLLRIYEVFLPDAEKAKEVRRILEDEDIKKARKKEMDRRSDERPDYTNGCK